MKKLIIIIFSGLVVSGFAQTQHRVQKRSLPEGSARSVGMSEKRLERISNMLQEAVENGNIPGAVALIARNGKIVYHQAFGMSDHESNIVLKKDDIFRIASQTKAITATAVMMLWEEGKFKLDDPISKYLPEFGNVQILDSLIERDTTYLVKPASTPISIRHLLTHTSGIGYGIIDSDVRFTKLYQKAGIIDLFTTTDACLKDNIQKLAHLPLHHNPGENFVYGESYDVLGHFIEVLSGMPLDQFFRIKIFDPLGMDDTWFYLPKSKYNRLVKVQEPEQGSWKVERNTFYDQDFPIKGSKTYFSGGAGLSSTARDYALFLQMYLNKGELNGHRLLSRTTINFMLQNQIGDIWAGGESYFGLGFRVINEKGEAMGGQGRAGTYDWGGYFNTQYFVDPKENIIGILYKQTASRVFVGDDTTWKFRLLVEQAIDD